MSLGELALKDEARDRLLDLRDRYTIGTGFRTAGTMYRPEAVNASCEASRYSDFRSVDARLELEPSNAFDENAIKVLLSSGGVERHVGYVPMKLGWQYSSNAALPRVWVVKMGPLVEATPQNKKKLAHVWLAVEG